MRPSKLGEEGSYTAEVSSAARRTRTHELHAGAMTEPSLNNAGREIWFVPAHGPDGGVYRAVTPKGRRAFRLAALWVLGCGTIFPILFVVTREFWWLLLMFLACGAGLVKFGLTVARHS